MIIIAAYALMFNHLIKSGAFVLQQTTYKNRENIDIINTFSVFCFVLNMRTLFNNMHMRVRYFNTFLFKFSD